MGLKNFHKYIGPFIEGIIRNYHTSRHKNYLLKCPYCKQAGLEYFQTPVKKMPFLKKVEVLLRNEYRCKSCDTFVEAKDVIKLELQKGDDHFIDDDEIKRLKVEEKKDKSQEKKASLGVKKLFTEIPKKEVMKLKLKLLPKKPKKDKKIIKLEKEINSYDEKDFHDAEEVEI